MDEQSLRYFLAVVRSGSIRRAADGLNVAASAISRRITELEARCGLPLLERRPRGVAPTEAGKAVAAHAQQIAEDAEQLSNYLRGLRGSHQGRIRLCCGEGFVADLVEHGVLPFTEAHPDLSIQLSIHGTDQLLDLVANGEADLGLAYTPAPHAGTRSVMVSPQPLCAIVPPRHPYAEGSRLALRALIGEPIALLAEGHGVRQLIERVEAEQGFRLSPRLESGSVEVLRRHVLAGAAVSVLPWFAVSEEIAQRRLVAIPLIDSILAGACAHLLVRAYRRLPPAVEELIGLLSNELLSFRLNGFRQMLPDRQRVFSKLFL